MSNLCQFKQLGIQCTGDNGHDGDHTLPADAVMAAVTGNMTEELRLTKEDERRTVSVADHKRGMHRLRNDLNLIIRSFQEALVTAQVRSNHSWNAMNAILMAFLDKGLITAEDIEDAGKKLFAQHQENLAAVKRAAEQKRKVENNELIPSPLDEVKDILYTGRQKGGDDDGNESSDEKDTP